MMKRLLLIATLLLVMMPAVKAQSFEFRYHGQPLADGATLTIAAEEDPFGFGEMWCETNPSDNPTEGLMLVLLSGSSAQGSATLTINENTLDASVLSWCMGGACVPFGNNTILEKNFTVQNGAMQVQFDAQNIQADNSHLLATLVTTIGGETHTVKIKFTHGEQQVVVPGDVNGDGNVTAADVTALYSILLSNDYTGVVNADQSGDGQVTAADVTAVYNILLGS